MKKLFLAALAAFTISFVAQAQDESKFSLDARVGLNLASTTSKVQAPTSKTMLLGLNLGVYANYNLAPTFALQAGLVYSGKGESTKSDFIKGSTTLNYLEIPINAVYKIPAGEQLKIVINAGPYLAYALNGKYKASGSGFDFNENVEFGSDAGKLKRTDFGLNVGAGVEITDKILINLNYGLGLTNLNNLTGSNAQTINNRVFSITAGYRLFSK
ncbi:MAG: PorT family protein [Bacteroidetes bacterium]|nr:MAG: PorT family protein [Bacteroidota bacterium]